MSELDLPPQRDFIDGSWSEPVEERDEWIEHASDGRPVQIQAATGPEALESALAAAWRMHESGDWSRRTAEERADVLDALAAALESRVPDVARLESATSGVVIGTTSMLGFIVHGAFGLAAAQLRDGVLSRTLDGPTGRVVEVDRQPWGPALLLCPWNAPAPMAAHKMASALAAGCPVIVKPPERAPHGTAALAEAADEVGLPVGLVQLVHGGPEVASHLMADRRVRAVSFTGGIVGGRAVAHACAEDLKPAQLELGGHSPLVVMPDASLDDTAMATTALLTTLNGQWCRALGRLLVPEDRHDAVVEAVLAQLTEVTIGDPLDPSSDMGPLVHSTHRAELGNRLTQFVADGGVAHHPTPRPAGPGNWFAPTLITGVDADRADREVFGPVATVHPYRDLDEAVALANGTEYGLEAYVVGTDEEAALDVARRIRAGGVKVNGVSPISLNLMAPRPAFGISGLHEEGTIETIQFFGGNRVVGVEGSLAG